MSGILGVFRLDGAPPDPRDLARLSGASRTRAVDGEAFWAGASAAIGHQYSRVTPEATTERQPFVAGDAVISFDGRLDNREELIQSCAADLAREEPPSDAALVLAAYRAYGDRCAARLVGDFAFALFDTRDQRLLLARDIMAARTLYYAPFRDGVAFASEIKSLLAHPAIAARPDEDALADLLLNGYWDGHTMWFDGIHSVPPGSIVTATRSGLAVTRAWDFDDREIRYASSAEYVDHFRMLFAQAVKRRLRSAHPVAVAVSGGVDSSAIHCEAARAGGVDVRGVTMAFPRGTAADEHQFVDVLRASGLRIDAVPVECVRWVVDADRSVARMEMPSLIWEQQDAMLAHARQRGCRVLLSGFFGDQLLTGDACLVDLARSGRFGLVRRRLRETASWMTDVDPTVLRGAFLRAAARAVAPDWMLRGIRVARRSVRNPDVYAPWFTKSFRDRASQRALDRLRRSRRFASAHAEECWQLATSGHYLASLVQTGNAGLAHQLETTYPFRDRDLVAFLMAVPGHIVSEGGVPKALLRRGVEGVLPDEIRLRRSKGDGTAFSNGAALAAEQTVRRMIGPESLSARAGLVDAHVLRSKMPAIFGDALMRHDSARIGWQVGDTLALELWLQRFCNGAICN